MDRYWLRSWRQNRARYSTYEQALCHSGNIQKPRLDTAHGTLWRLAVGIQTGVKIMVSPVRIGSAGVHRSAAPLVERTFAWLSHNRRMSKDYERLRSTGEALAYAAMTSLIIRRLVQP